MSHPVARVRKRRIWRVLVAGLGLLASTTLAPSGAVAADAPYFVYSVHGDLNGDGLSDDIGYASDPADPYKDALVVKNGLCAIAVKYGKAGGGFTAPTTYQVAKKDFDCPRYGTVFDVGGDGVRDLVLSSDFIGSIVVVGFTTVQELSSMYSYAVRALVDFNGDGLKDLVNLSGDDYPTTQVLYNGRDYRLVPGPTYQFDADAKSVINADGDNKADLVLGGYDYYAEHPGCKMALHLGSGKASTFQAKSAASCGVPSRVRANADAFDDIVTAPVEAGVTVAHYIGNAKGAFKLAPTALADALTVKRYQATTLRVLANDWVTSAVKVSVVSKSAGVTVTVNADKSLTIRAGSTTPTGASVVVKLTDDGRTSSSTVALTVTA
jgi:hypothetical protein